MPETQELTSEQKAARNDAIRAAMPIAIHKGDRFVITAGLRWLGPDAIADAIKQTKAQTEFEPGNDPYGEHDFGSFELFTGDKCFWKIDDYNGYDGLRCVVTIMLAEEY